MDEGEQTISKEEGRVACYRLLKEWDGCEIILSRPRYVNATIIDELLCAKIKIIGGEVLCRSLLDRCFLLWRELGLELIGDHLRNLALNCKNIGQVAIVDFRPFMSICARVDSLRVDADLSASTLHAAFK